MRFFRATRKIDFDRVDEVDSESRRVSRDNETTRKQDAGERARARPAKHPNSTRKEFRRVSNASQDGCARFGGYGRYIVAWIVRIGRGVGGKGAKKAAFMTPRRQTGRQASRQAGRQKRFE